MQYRTKIKAIAKGQRPPKQAEVVAAIGAAADAICRSNVIYHDIDKKRLVFAGSKEDLRMVLALEMALSIAESWYLGKSKVVEKVRKALRSAVKIPPPPNPPKRGPWVEAYKSAHYAADLLDQVFSGKDVPNILERLEYQTNYLLGAIRQLKRKHGK